MAAGSVDALEAALRALVDEDVDALEAVTLHDDLVRLCRAAHVLDAAVAQRLAPWVQRGVWAGDGSRSAAARLSREVGESPTSSQRTIRRALALAEMPAARAAVECGRLSMDHVDVLARSRAQGREEVFADAEPELVGHLATCRFALGSRMLGYWVQAADDVLGRDPLEAARAQVERSYVHASTTFEGTVRLDGELDPIAGATVTAVLDRIERELHLSDQAAGAVRSVPNRRAAALVEMARRAGAAPAAGTSPRPLFTVVIGDDRFRQLCELADGTVITPGHLVPHLGAADIETFLFDGMTAVGASTQRTFRGRLRRAIEVRDRRCQHPSGCDEPVERCDVDHIVPAADGGPTTQFNGRLGCRPHNRHAGRDHPDKRPRPDRPVAADDVDRLRRRWRDDHGTDAGARGPRGDPARPVAPAQDVVVAARPGGWCLVRARADSRAASDAVPAVVEAMCTAAASAAG